MLAVGVTFGGVPVPHALTTWALVGVSVLLGLLVKFAIVYLTGLLCFWTQSSLGISWMRQAIASLFSGAVVPLVFSPPWLAALAAALPFQAIVHIPAQIYMERATSTAALGLIDVQLAWLLALLITGRMLWHWAIRAITIDGG